MSISQHNTGRATAYNYMLPHERAASFIKSSIYFSTKNIEELTSEIKMWGEPEVVSRLGEDVCYMKKCQAESLLKEHQSEKQTWETLFDKLGACKSCNGGGWYWQNVSQDESIKVTCADCNGTGKTPTALGTSLTAATAAAKGIGTGGGAANQKPKPGILELIGRKFR